MENFVFYEKKQPIWCTIAYKQRNKAKWGTSAISKEGAKRKLYPL